MGRDITEISDLCCRRLNLSTFPARMQLFLVFVPRSRLFCFYALKWYCRDQKQWSSDHFGLALGEERSRCGVDSPTICQVQRTLRRQELPHPPQKNPIDNNCCVLCFLVSIHSLFSSSQEAEPRSAGPSCRTAVTATGLVDI